MEEKKTIKRQPRILEKIGELKLVDGVEASDVIFFNGKRQITLSKVGENQYEILGVPANDNK